MVIVWMMSVVLKFLHHSLIQAIFEMTQFKTPSGTYDPIWLISRFLNTAYKDKAAYIATGSLRFFFCFFLNSLWICIVFLKVMKVQLSSIEQAMALPASGLLIAAPQPPTPNRGGGGGGITLTKGALPIGYMDYGIQDWLINYMN